MPAGNMHLQASDGNIITVNAQDGGNATCLIPSSGGVLATDTLSKVASCVLINGDVVIDNSITTKSNANITYIGNGTTQVLTTGISSVDFTVSGNGSGFWHDRASGNCTVKNDAGTIIESGTIVINTSKVHIKKRSASGHNWFTDGLRGVRKDISPNLTNAETVYGNTVTNFNINGITIGELGDHNQVSQTFILHQTLYTHIKWGLTSQGKRYICAYNPITRETMTMYRGSSVIGHTIPNPLGIKLDWVEIKCLTSAGTAWQCTNNGVDRLILNLTNAVSVADGYAPTLNKDSISFNNSSATLIDMNTNNETYIMYGFANSETKVVMKYGGNGVAGNVLQIKDVNGKFKKPRRIIIKRINGVTDWWIYDTVRGELAITTYSATGVAEGVYEIGRFQSNGLLFLDTTVMNANGGKFLLIVEFDTTNSNNDTYFNLPTDNSNLSITNGNFLSTHGKSPIGYIVKSEPFTGSIDFAGVSDGIKYVAKDYGSNSFRFLDTIPSIGLYDKTSSNDNRLVFLDGGIWTTTGGAAFENDGSTTTGFLIGSTATVTSVNNTLIVTSTAAANSRVYVAIPTTIGETYKLTINCLGGTSSPLFRLGITENDTRYINKTMSTGETLDIEFTAVSALTYMTLYNNSATTGHTTVWDNISVYKKRATIDQILTPISFLETPVMVVSETPVGFREDKPKISRNIMESTIIDGKLEVKDNMVYLDKPIFKGIAREANITSPGVMFNWLTELDTHNAFSNGLWTCPKDGWYRINPRIWNHHGDGTSTVINSQLHINDIAKCSFYSTGTVTSAHQGISTTLIENLKKGDTMYIVSMSASASHFIWFQSAYHHTNIVIEYIGETK